jgi:hypothetical protein
MPRCKVSLLLISLALGLMLVMPLGYISKPVLEMAPSVE